MWSFPFSAGIPRKLIPIPEHPPMCWKLLCKRYSISFYNLSIIIEPSWIGQLTLILTVCKFDDLDNDLLGPIMILSALIAVRVILCKENYIRNVRKKKYHNWLKKKPHTRPHTKTTTWNALLAPLVSVVEFLLKKKLEQSYKYWL